jgi:hypothetical protein
MFVRRMWWLAYWSLPRLTATIVCAGAAFAFLRAAPPWAGLFAVCLVMLALVTLSAWMYPNRKPPEESLLTFVAPVVLALMGGAGVLFSLTFNYPGWPSRRIAHWTGIVMSFVPLAWWLFGFAHGWVFPRELFVSQVVRV